MPLPLLALAVVAPEAAAALEIAQTLLPTPPAPPEEEAGGDEML